MRKLSDLGTDECMDVLCEIAPCMQRIVDDKELMDALGKAIKREGLTAVGVIMAAASRIVGALPLLLKTHREDVYGILSAVGGVPTEEVKAQNVLTTMQQLQEILRDKPLLDFFGSFRHGEKAG